jgi:hypothetical protein
MSVTGCIAEVVGAGIDDGLSAKLERNSDGVDGSRSRHLGAKVVVVINHE